MIYTTSDVKYQDYLTRWKSVYSLVKLGRVTIETNIGAL